jgi:hypothetical protein
VRQNANVSLQMNQSVIFVLLMLPIAAASAPILPNAANCSLPSPPASAGEDKPQGQLMKMYPRAKDVTRSYTGCQRAWLWREGRWLIFSTRYYSAGVLRAFYGPELEGKATSVCLFQNGKLDAGSSGACPSFVEASKPAPSLAPGCVTASAQQSASCSKYE